MDFVSVCNGDKRSHSIISETLKRNIPVSGHVFGREFVAAYAASDRERSAFIDAAGRVADFAPEELVGLTPVADTIGLSSSVDGQGIFDA